MSEKWIHWSMYYRYPPGIQSKSVFDIDGICYNIKKRVIPEYLLQKIYDKIDIYINRKEEFKYRYSDDLFRLKIGFKKVINSMELYWELHQVVSTALWSTYPNHQLENNPKLLVTLEGYPMQTLHNDIMDQKTLDRLLLTIYIHLSIDSNLNIKTNNELFGKKYTNITHQPGDIVIMDGILALVGIANCNYD